MPRNPDNYEPGAVTLDPNVPVPLYPNLLYLLEQRLRQGHERLLIEGKNDALRARVDALSTASSEDGWPDTLELLEVLASTVRDLKMQVLQERANRERDFMRWRVRLRAEGAAK